MNNIPQEIEKKYLIREDWVRFNTDAFYQISPAVDSLQRRVLASGTPIRQGYLPLPQGIELADKLGMNLDFNPEEARLRDIGGKLYFTLKGRGGISRDEIESEIPQGLFANYWPITQGKRVEKVRLSMPYQGHTFEIDVYSDERDLIIAEVEVSNIEGVAKLTPIGLDVTENPKYKNRNLAK